MWSHVGGTHLGLDFQAGDLGVDGQEAPLPLLSHLGLGFWGRGAKNWAMCTRVCRRGNHL
jgi:hypothetical protein